MADPNPLPPELTPEQHAAGLAAADKLVADARAAQAKRPWWHLHLDAELLGGLLRAGCDDTLRAKRLVASRTEEASIEEINDYLGTEKPRTARR